MRDRRSALSGIEPVGRGNACRADCVEGQEAVYFEGVGGDACERVCEGGDWEDEGCLRLVSLLVFSCQHVCNKKCS